MEPNEFANQVIDSCSSTNDLAKSLIDAGFPHGTWISARSQTQGRGRLGRQWKSTEGNIFLSVIINIPDVSLWSWVPLTASVAIVRFLRSQYPPCDFKVKWPNDIWCGGYKLGGILCESGGMKAKSFIVIGVGLNCLHAPEILDQKVACLRSCVLQQKNQNVDPDQIRTELIREVLSLIAHLVSEGPSYVESLYSRWAQFPVGSKICWGIEEKSGTVIGLGPASELQVQDASGVKVKLYSEDVIGISG